MPTSHWGHCWLVCIQVTISSLNTHTLHITRPKLAALSCMRWLRAMEFTFNSTLAYTLVGPLPIISKHSTPTTLPHICTIIRICSAIPHWEHNWDPGINWATLIILLNHDTFDWVIHFQLMLLTDLHPLIITMNYSLLSNYGAIWITYRETLGLHQCGVLVFWSVANPAHLGFSINLLFV